MPSLRAEDAMSRTTPKPDRLQFVRKMDLEMVMAARIAADEAMKKVHERNPAGYHLARPTMTECVFDSSCPFTSDTEG
jgi:hypothetical protein